MGPSQVRALPHTLCSSSSLKYSDNSISYIFPEFFPSPGDFLGGPVVKNPSCNAGEASSIPGQGLKILHAAGQLKPTCCNYRVRTPQLESPLATTNEPVRSRACMPQVERSLRTATKSSRATTKDPACLN